MPHYKLYYFTSRGRSEAIRQLLSLAGQKWDDIRFKDDDDWNKNYKPHTPLGQAPVFEVDGVKFAQSTAILRYIAEQHGFAGKNPLDKAKVDMIGMHIQDLSNADGVRDWWMTLYGIHPQKEYNGKEGSALYFRTKVQPDIDRFSPVVEKFLKENPHGVLVGDSLTWADIFTAEQYAKFYDLADKKVLDPYPHIKALIEKVHNQPAIKKWIETRPVTVD